MDHQSCLHNPDGWRCSALVPRVHRGKLCQDNSCHDGDQAAAVKCTLQHAPADACKSAMHSSHCQSVVGSSPQLLPKSWQRIGKPAILFSLFFPSHLINPLQMQQFVGGDQFPAGSTPEIDEAPKEAGKAGAVFLSLLPVEPVQLVVVAVRVVVAALQAGTVL